MSSIKPIETVYDGHRFRSRLEARWAVFFNAMGIRYEYQPEGFTLEGIFNYLPDFKLYIPFYHWKDAYCVDGPIYAQVKGVMHASEISDYDAIRISLFADHHPIIILPSMDCFNDRQSIEQFVDDDKYVPWKNTEQCIRLMSTEMISRWYGDTAMFSRDKNTGLPILCDSFNGPSWDNGKSMASAINIARMARFEHGQTPQTSQQNRGDETSC